MNTVFMTGKKLKQMQIQDLEQYRQLAARTLNTEEAPYNTLLHVDAGIKGELGELIDIFKKHVIYGKELNISHIVEEYGDIMWYVVGKVTLKNMHLSGHNVSAIDSIVEYYENNTKHQKYSILNFLVYESPSLYAPINEYVGYMVFLGKLLEEKYENFNFWEALSFNIIKLQQRYPDKYTDQDALERKDKNETQ